MQIIRSLFIHDPNGRWIMRFPATEFTIHPASAVAILHYGMQRWFLCKPCEPNVQIGLDAILPPALIDNDQPNAIAHGLGELMEQKRVCGDQHIGLRGGRFLTLVSARCEVGAMRAIVAAADICFDVPADAQCVVHGVEV